MGTPPSSGRGARTPRYRLTRPDWPAIDRLTRHGTFLRHAGTGLLRLTRRLRLLLQARHQIRPGRNNRTRRRLADDRAGRLLARCGWRCGRGWLLARWPLNRRPGHCRRLSGRSRRTLRRRNRTPWFWRGRRRQWLTRSGEYLSRLGRRNRLGRDPGGLRRRGRLNPRRRLDGPGRPDLRRRLSWDDRRGALSARERRAQRPGRGALARQALRRSRFGR